MPDKAQEQQAIALFFESFRIMHGVKLAIRSDHAEDFPDFILSDSTANNEIEVLIGQEDAVEMCSNLGGSTMGFKEVWCTSIHWTAPQALVLAP